MEKEIRTGEYVWDGQPQAHYVWDRQPERMGFEMNGYPCIIMKHPEWKTLNGYVGIHEDHPANFFNDLSELVSMHGGMTFDSKGHTKEEYERLGYYKNGYKPLYDSQGRELYWIGFDCAHYGDITPSLEGHRREVRFFNWQKADFDKATAEVSMYDIPTYKTAEYVINELKSIIKQLEDIRKNTNKGE